MEYICLKRKKNFEIESNNYLDIFKNILQVETILKVNFIIFYEIENARNDNVNILKNKLFINDVKDQEVLFKSWNKNPHIVIKPLPLQFDNRADSATQIAILLTKNPDIKISSGIVLEFNKDASKIDVKKIKKYLINPLETYEYNFQKTNFINKVFTNIIIGNFIKFNENELLKIINNYKLALSLEDLKFIQKHYQKLNRNINISELQLFNTYWSDHCRHTTFNTHLLNIKFPKKLDSLNKCIYQTYKELSQDMKTYLINKPLTLMNMSKINAIKLKNTSYINDNLEVSDEVNACSIGFNVKNNKYFLSFKNETHNHPTEISPYGGAATCLGGAIRDILANRAYAFAGIRISGSADIFENINKTLKNKLPQRIISVKSSDGFSSYGNQIGMPTAFVKEFYHPGYKAKHLECGAVLGISTDKHLNKLKPLEGDLIYLFGGKTGIDGIGGASGSSKEHDKNSINLNSEVQNGNPIIEKKIQRLFRKNAIFSRLIKRCNDFGAGGASVAIGEIADSMEIYLDKFQIKYLNISPFEILFSESQERMAAVIDPKNYDQFIKCCHEENLEAYLVGKVTNNNKIIAKYHDQIIIDVDKQFLDSAGANRKIDLKISLQKVPSCFDIKFDIYKFKYEKEKLNNIFSKGLVEKFDSSIGNTSILSPYGGRHLLTKENVALISIPDVNIVNTNFAVILGIGFALDLEQFPFYLGYYSVVEAVLKIISKGGKLSKIYLSFQEFFPKAKKNHHWENMFLTILGAYKAMNEFKIAAIGGKDSVSGTFEKLEIPNTFICFAFSIENIKNSISNTLQANNSKIYLVNLYKDKNYFLDMEKNTLIFEKIYKWINNGVILSSDVLSENGILSTLCNNAYGNLQNFNLNYLDIFSKNIGSLIIETNVDLNEDFLIEIGSTSKHHVSQIYNTFSINLLDILNEKICILNDQNLFLPYAKKSENKSIVLSNTINSFKSLNKQTCTVLIPIFPGTNCEFDLGNKFKKEGAIIKYFVFNDLNLQNVQNSINKFALLINQCDILAIPGGFSSADEPDGSGKYIANILLEDRIYQEIQNHLKQKKLILGICNGFQALVLAKLLPGILNDQSTLTKNVINRHVSTLAMVRTVSANSPWINRKFLNTYSHIPISNGEGNFYIPEKQYQQLFKNNQIFSVYDKPENMKIFNEYEVVNLTNSKYAIEGILSKDGLILGRMGHSERICDNLYKNTNFLYGDNIFENAVRYIKNKS